MPRSGCLSFFVALLFLLSTTASSQEQQSAPSTPQAPSQAGNAPSSSQPTAVVRVTTRLVLVDVVALDKKGSALTDLKAEDFSLQEEGSDQKIRVFSFQQPSATENASAPIKLPASMVTNLPTYKADRALSVILLDALNTDVVTQKYMRQEMVKSLEKLPAGQPVAVYALGTKLLLLQDFTTDPSLLKQAIAASKRHSGSILEDHGAFLDAASTSALMEMGMQAMVQQIQLFQQESSAVQLDARVEITLAALNSLARTLAGYPGRKNLIWMSAAFPLQVLPTDSAIRNNLARGQLAQRDYSEQVRQTSNALSNARVAVYPVDATSLVNSSVYSSLSNTDSQGNYLGRTASGRGSSQSMGEELGRTSDALLGTHTSMNSVAEETGGKAFYNTNDISAAVREGLEDGGTYYTLGYYPEDKNWNGKFRRITVKVNRPGVKLRFRQGYFASDPRGYSKTDAKKQAMDLGQALNIENPISTALLFRAQVIPPSEKTQNKVLIYYGIDAHAMGFELRDDGLQHASIDCAAQPFTAKGNPLPPQGQPFSAGLKPEDFQTVMQKFFPCNLTLDLAPGDYTLRLAVRDNATGLIGTANAKVTVPPGPGAAKAEDKKP
jgi:VWFA-related protein